MSLSLAVFLAATVTTLAGAFGQVVIIFVITIAAAELTLAMAIILRLYRNRSSVNIDTVNSMR